MKLVILSLIAALLCGCVSRSNELVPKTKIVGDFQRGTFSMELPKDLTAENIDVVKGDGELSVKIKGIKVRTNPEVIGTAGQAQTDALDAVGKNTIEAVKTGVDIYKKSLTP